MVGVAAIDGVDAVIGAEGETRLFVAAPVESTEAEPSIVFPL